MMCTEVKLRVGAFGGRQFPVIRFACIEDWMSTLKVVIRGDYYEERSGNETRRTMMLGEYLERSQPEGLLCPEMPVPQSCISMIEVSASDEGVMLPLSCVAIAHAGRPGSISPLHFDWDHRWVLHCCLSGRKRFLLFPPTAGWLLTPVLNTSALWIPRFSADDRAALVGLLQGREVVLEAGEALAFPSTYWHCAMYDTPSFAVSLRFEEHATCRPLGVLPRCWLLQRIVSRWIEDGVTTGEAGQFTDVCFSHFFDQSTDWFGRWQAMQCVYGDVLVARGERSGAGCYTSAEFSPEVGIATSETQHAYTYDPAASYADDEDVERVQSYLFESELVVSLTMRRAIAAHAIAAKTGLPPARGLVPIRTQQ